MAEKRAKLNGTPKGAPKELGVHRRLRKCRDQLEPIGDGEAEPENGKERELRLQVTRLMQV